MSEAAAILPTTPKGKIARLPARLREAVNRRLHDGETAGQILPWLNSQPEVVKMLELHFEGEAVSAQNLSAWRQGGFQKWLEQKQQIEDAKELSAFSVEVAKACGLSVVDGTAAIAAGQVMRMLTGVGASDDEGGGVAAASPKLLTAIANLQSAATGRKKLDHIKRKLDQKDRELELAEKAFQFRTAETFLKFFAEEETRRIASSGERKETKVKELVQHWFGTMPDGIGPEGLS